MKLIASLHGSRKELIAQLKVTSEKAEFIDNIGNELWQPKAIRRMIIGTIEVRGNLWNEYIEWWQTMTPDRSQIDGVDYFWVRGLQIDNDFYGGQNSTHLSVTNGVVKIVAFEKPLEIEETDFNEDNYFKRVKERNLGKQFRIIELIKKLRRQEKSIDSGVSKNDIRQLS